MPKKFDPMDQTSEEAPQCPEDARAPGYDNEVPVKSWLRAAVKTQPKCRISIIPAK